MVDLMVDLDSKMAVQSVDLKALQMVDRLGWL